jgi:ankyrin repeat protein
MLAAVSVLAADATIQSGPDTRLATLAMHGDRDGAKELLKQKVNVNAAQGDGMTALHWAAMKNDLALTEMLLAAGADVRATTRVEALTPLLVAANNGNAPVILALLKAGADVNRANDLGTTPLMLASGSGDTDSVKALLAAGASVNAKDTKMEQTAAMFAAGLNRDNIIRMLAAKGADLNATSAVTKLARVLFDEEGNPLPAARAGQVTTQAAGGSAATFMGGWSALHFAARDGYMASVRALLESGANINVPGAGDKTTPLVMAIENGHFDVAKFFIEKGANPSLANDGGLTAIYAAIDCQWAPVAWAPVPDTSKEKTSYMDLLRLLVDHGAEVNTKLAAGLWYRPADHNQAWVKLPGSNAFWRASQSTDLEAMKFLATHGANVKDVSNNKDTALMMAAGVGWAGNFSTNAPGSYMPVVKYLVEELGIDINAVDAQGYTAVMGAAYRGDNEMVEYLVSKGAKLDFRTSRGWSVTDMANGPALRSSVPLSHPETIALLTKLGAPPLLKVEGEEILGIIRGKAPVVKKAEEGAAKDKKPEEKKQ